MAESNAPGGRPPSTGASGTTPSSPGAQINEYRILKALGRGGMANVYLGERPDGRKAAVKLLLPQFAQDPEIVRRFLLEMKATAQVHHDNVIEILDFGDFRGHYYLATEFMNAGSLRDLTLRAGGRLPPPTAFAIVAMLLRGLAAAHAQSLVHRDVKPANLLLRSDGVAKLSDFGIARSLELPGVTRTGLLMGTPAYMSPEQARGEKIDARSDLFSAGVVLFELIAGFNPFGAPNEAGSLTKVLAVDAPPMFEVNPALPPYLEPLFAKLFTASPDTRFQRADEVVAELVRWIPAAADGRDLVREAIADAAGAWPKWAEQEAKSRYARAERLLAEGPARRPMALLELYRAHHLAPTATFAEARLRELLLGRDPFGPTTNPKIAELELELAKQPANHALLMQLAALCKLEQRLLKSIAYYKRALRLRPEDGFAAGQLRTLIGEEADLSLISGQLSLKTAPAAHVSSPPATGQTAPSLRLPRELLAAASTSLYQPPPPVSGWRRLAPKLAWAAVAILVVAGVVSLVHRFIAASTASVDEQTERLRRGIHDGPASAETTSAIAHLSAARRDQAEAEFDAAAKLVTTDPDRGGEALEAFRRDHPKSAHVAEATFLIASAEVKNARYLTAEQELTDFIRDAPGDAHVPQARLLLATCLNERGALDPALDELNGLITDHPESPLVTEALAREALLFEKKSDLEDARARWREVMSRTGPADAVHQQAVQALARLGGG